MSTYRISKNMPVPSRSNTAEFPWRKMVVGDSFFVPADKAGADAKRVYQSAYNLKRRIAELFRFSIRKVHGGYRAWRIGA